MLENVSMNIRKDERCFFERCSLRKTFCDLSCVHSYLVCVSIILKSLSIILTTMWNSNSWVNLLENVWEYRKTCEMFLCVKSLPCVQSNLVCVSLTRDRLFLSLVFYSHFHLSNEKVWKNFEIFEIYAVVYFEIVIFFCCCCSTLYYYIIYYYYYYYYYLLLLLKRKSRQS